MLLRLSQASSERGLKIIAVCTARKRTSLNVLLLERHTVNVGTRRIDHESAVASCRFVREQGIEEQTAAAPLHPHKQGAGKGTEQNHKDENICTHEDRVEKPSPVHRPADPLVSILSLAYRTQHRPHRK